MERGSLTTSTATSAQLEMVDFLALNYTHMSAAVYRVSLEERNPRGVSSGQGRHRLGNTIVSMLWDMKRRESFKESLACGKVSEGGEL